MPHRRRMTAAQELARRSDDLHTALKQAAPMVGAVQEAAERLIAVIENQRAGRR